MLYNIAMKKKKTPSQHLEIQKSGSKYIGIMRTTFREDGKIKHTSHGTIKNKTLQELKLIQAAMRGDIVLKGNIGTPKVRESKEYGASYAVLQLAKQLELDKAIFQDHQSNGLKMPLR